MLEEPICVANVMLHMVQTSNYIQQVVAFEATEVKFCGSRPTGRQAQNRVVQLQTEARSMKEARLAQTLARVCPSGR